MGRVCSEGIELLGEGGLLPELTKRLMERAMDDESPNILVTSVATQPGVVRGTAATARPRNGC